MDVCCLVGAQSYTGRRVPGYPINQIGIPIALFYGGRDFLVDTPSLLKNLPKTTFQHEACASHLASLPLPRAGDCLSLRCVFVCSLFSGAEL